jgi:nucleoside-diphosphate-sugar epimerase
MALGDGRHPLPWVLVQDVAQALFSAAYAPGIEGQSFNLAGDVRPSAREFVSWIADRSLRDIRFRPTSLGHLYAVALGKWVVKKAGGAAGRFPTYREFKSSAMISDIDCAAAKRMLNWRPNADVDFFIQEAIDSHVKPFHSHDLRLNPSPYGAMRG